VDPRDLRRPGEHIRQMAVQSDQIWAVLSDVKISEDQKSLSERPYRGGCRQKLARGNNWKIGEKIVLKKGLWPADFELTLRGIYEAQDESALYFQWDYFNEALNNQGIVGWYWIKAKSAEAVPRVAQKVDAMFQNTTAPQKTESEKAFVLGFISMMGNVAADDQDDLYGRCLRHHPGGGKYDGDVDSRTSAGNRYPESPWFSSKPNPGAG